MWTGKKLPELNISVLVSIILEQEKCRFFDDLYGKQIIDAFDKGSLISEDNILQLNEYETDPYFLLLSQNVATT